MDQAFMGTAPPVDKPTQKQFLESPIGPFRAELWLNFDTKEGTESYRLSIEAPTFKAVRGIYQGASALLLGIASQDLSNGE